MTAVDARSVGPARTRARSARKSAPDLPYINRELSWLDYAGRVLWRRATQRNPLLERVRFLTIFASMLDEFFQVRISGLRQQVAAGRSRCRRTVGPRPSSSAAARARVLELIEELTTTYAEMRAGLAAEGIEIVDYAAIPEHHADAPRAVPRRDLPGPDAARGRSRPPVPVHLARSACRSRSVSATRRRARPASPASRCPRSCRA